MSGHRVLFRSSAAMMPSAGTLCQLLTLGLLVETRLRVATVQGQPEQHDTARRALDGASFVTVAQAQAIMADHVADAGAGMRGKLDASNRMAEQTIANMTEHFSSRIQRLERDVDSLRGVSSSAAASGDTPRHRKQEASEPTAACYSADEIAMAALNALIALSQSHGQLQAQLSSKVDARTVDQRLAVKMDVVVVSAQLDAKANSSTVDGSCCARPTWR